MGDGTQLYPSPLFNNNYFMENQNKDKDYKEYAQYLGIKATPVSPDTILQCMINILNLYEIKRKP